ncbi:MAG: type II toxin-antitoxin system VapC family toxin [Anaerolineae bacterium]|jgi:predicted nucleic acid-binding protein
MDIVERLTAHTTVGLDTSVFIYQLEAHPDYLPITQTLFTCVQAGRWAAITSTITLMELTGRPWQIDRPAVACEYETLLVHFPHLTILDVTRDVARRAAQLRAEYRLRPADALQIGTAIVHGATAFVSNDRALLRVAPTLDIVMLEQLRIADQRS